MRLPNGFGTITRLNGNRRKPYSARAVCGRYENGRTKYKLIGCYETYNDALNALTKYNTEHGELINDTWRITVRDVFESLIDMNKKRKSESTIKAWKTAANNLGDVIMNKSYKRVKPMAIQVIIDELKTKPAAQQQIQSLWRSIEKQAHLMGIDENFKDTTFVLVKHKSREKEPFTNEEIAKLWASYNGGNKGAAIPLILIFSGWRLSELLTMETQNVNINSMTWSGGKKTEAGKRTIPIHSKILPLVKELYNEDSTYLIDGKGKDRIQLQRWLYYQEWTRVLQEAGIYEKHTPHDCRHTFQSLLFSKGVSYAMSARLLGHSVGAVTYDVYTHITIEQMRKELEKI